MTHVLNRGSLRRRSSVGLIGRLIRWDAHYRSRQRLADLSDNMLDDIGLSKDQAGRNANSDWPAANWMKQPW